MERDTKLTYQNVRYGTLVEVIHKHGGYHAGCKVHFYNKKGVLVGNYYEFMPYERLRLRTTKDRDYPRYFMDDRLERIKMFFFKILLNATDKIIRITQSKMHSI